MIDIFSQKNEFFILFFLILVYIYLNNFKIMKWYVVIFLMILVLFSSCDGPDSCPDSNGGNMLNVEIIETKIDELSGYSRDDLLKVFINEIKKPVDSVFNTCLNEINKTGNTTDENTLYSDDAQINETIKFVEYKIDKFEKFRSYQMDSSIKNKMLDYLKIYLNLLKQDYKEMIVFKYQAANLTDNERNTYLECLSVIDEKIYAAESLLEEILFEYSYIHNKA